MMRAPAVALIWMLALLAGGPPFASAPVSVRQQVAAALRQGGVKAEHAYAGHAGERIQVGAGSRSAPPRHTSASADVLRPVRAAFLDADRGGVDSRAAAVTRRACGAPDGAPRFPTGPPPLV